jgi:hypothetical protein
MPLHIFSLCDEVLLYFVLRVKSLKFKFDLNSNWFGIYKIDLKKDKGFSIFPSLLG